MVFNQIKSAFHYIAFAAVAIPVALFSASNANAGNTNFESEGELFIQGGSATPTQEIDNYENTSKKSYAGSPWIRSGIEAMVVIPVGKSSFDGFANTGASFGHTSFTTRKEGEYGVIDRSKIYFNPGVAFSGDKEKSFTFGAGPSFEAGGLDFQRNLVADSKADDVPIDGAGADLNNTYTGAHAIASVNSALSLSGEIAGGFGVINYPMSDDASGNKGWAGFELAFRRSKGGDSLNISGNYSSSSSRSNDGQLRIKNGISEVAMNYFFGENDVGIGVGYTHEEMEIINDPDGEANRMSMALGNDTVSAGIRTRFSMQ